MWYQQHQETKGQPYGESTLLVCWGLNKNSARPNSGDLSCFKLQAKVNSNHKTLPVYCCTSSLGEISIARNSTGRGHLKIQHVAFLDSVLCVSPLGPS